MELIIKHKSLIFLFITIILTAAVIIFFGIDYSRILNYLTDGESQPIGLLLLFAFLPLFGFPIFPFLILLGLRFGTRTGTMILFGGVAFHLSLSYLISHSFLKYYVIMLATRLNIVIPRIPEKKMVLWSFLFMVIPGLSYAMKNYILPLTGIRFRQYFFIGLITQGGTGIPIIFAGEVVESGNFIIPVMIFMVVLAVYLILLRIRKKRLSHLPFSGREKKR